ncbi:hypothetical protein Maq22A_c28560 [Methylobacterium aquaticum]|uniref:Uncharacterized protein n=1 Tax=Methylobacterium aquaticum TaxID=270351 RepID=A0A1Y0Z8W7_9HYPH|nr:hypothetical protein Maq22A_c28560 [Methylobacterium aquaticum]
MPAPSRSTVETDSPPGRPTGSGSGASAAPARTGLTGGRQARPMSPSRRRLRTRDPGSPDFVPVAEPDPLLRAQDPPGFGERTRVAASG